MNEALYQEMAEPEEQVDPRVRVGSWPRSRSVR